jgi:putative ATP-dependent endonuclease of the OLD family
VTSTDSDSVLESVVPHFNHVTGPMLPAARHGTGLVSLQSLLLLMQFGKARAETNRSFVLAVEEPELHIQPSQQKRLVNRLNALCNQTIVTTHSPNVAALFAPSDILFLQNRDGLLTARPLVDVLPAAPTNHQQHLLYAWRQKLISALMHEVALIPEGVSDVAWLETLQNALEMQQDWDEKGGADNSRLSTFVGAIPTMDAKLSETFNIVKSVHSNPCVLLDGDAAGRAYFDALSIGPSRPKCVVFWPADFAIEHVVAWIAAADELSALKGLGAALGESFATLDDLSEFLLERKSYTPTHDAVAVTLMANIACRKRAAALLNGLSDLLRVPSTSIPLFAKLEADCKPDMFVFQLCHDI